MKIGEYIKLQRNINDMSQRELAQAAGLSNAEISRIESGIRKQPSPEVLRSIALALNISYEHLYIVAGYLDAVSKEISLSAGANNSAITGDEYLDVADLTPNEVADVKKYIQFLKSQR